VGFRRESPQSKDRAAGSNWGIYVLSIPAMTNFDPEDTHTRLESIVTLVQNRDAETALSQISDLVTELKSTEEHDAARPFGPPDADREPEPQRVISAHLKGAEVHINDTHLALAEESLEKALGVVMDEKGPAVAKGAA
jgi:hypothetical protein